MKIINKIYKLLKTHEKFTEKYGGKVFYVFSIKGENGKKTLENPEVIVEIKKRIKRIK